MTPGTYYSFADGAAIRIDRVTDASVYFVEWLPGVVVGAPKRMAPALFAEAVASEAERRGGVVEERP